MGRIRTYIADGHPIYRRGLLTALHAEPSIEVVGEASTGPEAIDGILRLEPQVVVMEIFLRERSGIEVLAALKAAGSSSLVLMLTGSDDDEAVYQSIIQGASGYLLKIADAGQIIAAIKKVSEGGRVIDPFVAVTIAARIENGEDCLTKRELEILTMIAHDLSAEEISKRLHLQTTTVTAHLRHSYPKLGVKSRAAAIAEAMRRRLIR